MQIPKISLFICTLALSGGLALHAQDNPAQAAARAALLEKMNDLEANPSVATPAPAPTAPVAPPVVVAPAAVEIAPAAPAAVTAPVVEVAPAVAPAPDTAKVEADAKKAAQANAKAEKEAKIKAQKDADAQKAAALAEQKRAAEAAKKQAVFEAKKRAANEKAHVVTPVNEPAKELGLAQVNAPALPIAQTKQGKLASLLQLYKADQLSPEEYQSKRAAIIAEP